MTARSLVELLDRSARRYGANVAIVDDAGATTYAELWGRSCAFARYLATEGLQPGDRVALVLESTADFVAAYYGTLMAGGIAVSLNAAAKARDLGIWLGHSEPRWLVQQAGNAEADGAWAGLRDKPHRILRGGAESGGPADAVALADILRRPVGVCAAPPVREGDAASILYTSGTTGRPKGVVLSHGNLASNVEGIIEYLGLTAEDSIVSLLPFYYSYGNSVLHTHLACGARVILHTNFVYPHAVVERLVAERASGFSGVPSTYALLLGRVTLERYDLRSLRYVTQAGGAMPAALVERLRRVLPGVAVFLMYGQTEATARLSYLPPRDLDRKRGSVGIPVPGCQIAIRRDDGIAALPGEIGGVWAKGPNVMLGYWRDPEATAAAIRDGWLSTGDVGYLDDDGYLFLVGRRADIIKTGAHRVHPKDVEEVIAELRGVVEVAVVGVDDELLGQAIKAYVVLDAQAALAPKDIKSHARQRLAGYKVPKIVEVTDALPKTSSGKIRRTELAARS